MNKNSLRILLVEDNEGDARLLREMFRGEAPGSFELTHLLRMSDAMVHLAKGSADIVLLDMGLPDAHGLDTVRMAHAVAPNVPLIVISGLDDEALAAQAMKEGAQDYLIKGQIENRALPRALRHAIERHRMQAEADLVRTNQLQFKDEFLSHVSHELRSPLTAIYQFVTILLDRLAGELNPEQLEYLGIILRNTKQLQSMINDLLEVTRMQAAKLKIDLQCTSASAAVLDAVNTLRGAAEAKRITLNSTITEPLHPVCADPTRLRQILIILLDNAIKFTPPGGLVSLHAGIFPEDSSLLLLTVSDSGCGIAADMTERIFERLFQTAHPDLGGRNGLGLGLYICKDLVNRQGGRMWAAASQGQGAVLSVVLPIFSLSNLIAPALKRERHTQGPVVLIVIEIASQTAWLSDADRVEKSQGIREILQGCLHSDMDILLPKMSASGPTELFFILAITDDIGAAAIAKRVRERLQSSAALQLAGFTTAVSHRSLEPIKRDATESMKNFSERVATQLQQLMNDEISSRMVTHV
ncbi:MAG: hybrid sensor histidine kinase/response regulator [Candidatus Acidiferrum sp.]|jgi:signal transduction histidine kinase